LIYISCLSVFVFIIWNITYWSWVTSGSLVPETCNWWCMSENANGQNVEWYSLRKKMYGLASWVFVTYNFIFFEHDRSREPFSLNNNLENIKENGRSTSWFARIIYRDVGFSMIVSKLYVTRLETGILNQQNYTQVFRQVSCSISYNKIFTVLLDNSFYAWLKRKKTGYGLCFYNNFIIKTYPYLIFWIYKLCFY